jgi:hypothetical protein
MLASLRQSSGTIRDLGRVLAGWLTVLLLVQGLAATVSLVSGPPHRHGAAAFERLGDAHATAHALHHAHSHAAGDGFIVVEADMPALDAGALQLLSLLTALPSGVAPVASAGEPVRCARGQHAFASHVPALPLRPPRRLS